MADAPTLTTPRLNLVPLHAGHADSLFELYRDAETLAYWHTLPHRSLNDTRAMVAHLMGGDSPWWAVTLADSGRVIGLVGLFLGALVPGMGYIIQRDLWRQGYGSEAVRAAADYAFTTLGQSRLELWIHAGNVASQRLAQAVGFRQRGQFMQAAPHLGRYETLVYGLRAADWPGQTPPAPEHAFYGIYPVIPTADVAASVAFYRDLLGFHVSFQSPQYAIVARAEWTSERAELHFVHEPGPMAPAASLRLPVGPGVGALYDALQQRGVTMATPILAKPWGREFEVIDNNGWQLVFMGVG